MKAILAAVVLVGVSVGTAKAETPPTDYSTQREARRAKASQAALEKDARLATKLANAPPQKIGILTYYPNKGGGYTFIEGKDIVFYALPYTPSTYKVECRVPVCRETEDGGTELIPVPTSINVATIGPSTTPFGGQTVYRTEMFNNGKDGFSREDIRLAYWSRDTSDGKFQLWILTEDRETRLKLKSIVPVLETSLLAEQKSTAHKPAPPITYEVIASKAGGDYVFFQNGQRIAYSKGFDLFLCPSSNIKPSLKTDTLILDAGLKGGRGWMPAYQRLQPRPFTGPQQEEIVNLLFDGQDPTENGIRHQLTTDGVVRIKLPEFEPPPSR
jgi:hypothetical protein